MFGIIGSGFGLYGYLPVILENNDQVLLLTKSKETLLSRSDINLFYDRIKWIDSIDSLINQATHLVISVPPFVQYELLLKIIMNQTVENLIIEKPIAETPDKSIEILNKLSKLSMNYRVAYLFLYTHWFQKLQNICTSPSNLNQHLTININWQFKAHHYKNNLNNWKRNTAEGGGAMRFFGIHLIAVLAKLDMQKVLYSNIYNFNINDNFKWEGSCSNKSNSIITNLIVDSNAEIDSFDVKVSDSNSENVFIYEKKSPFDEEANAKTDIRFDVLNSLIDSLQNKGENNNNLLYDSVNLLWKDFERTNTLNLIK